MDHDHTTLAAYAAYENAKSPAAQADALAALGNLEARNESWRIALDAYHASLDRKDDPDARAIYEDLEKNPVALNAFRGTKFTLEVATITGSAVTILSTGGLSLPFVVATERSREP